MMYQGNWTPHAGIARHSGSQIPSDTEFFAPPPLEIGNVISAESNLTPAKQPIATGIRIGISLFLGLALVFGIRYLFKNEIVAIAVGGISATIAYLIMEFRYSCSYVGERGIAKLSISGSRSAIPKHHLLCFQDATNLFTKQTRNYVNGVYTGTEYSYRWTKRSGKDYILNGLYRAQNQSPADKDAWHFANTAERLWTLYLLDTVNDGLERLGYVEFPIGGNPKAVRVGSGFMEFVVRDGTSQRVAVADMKDITLGSGIFQFKHKDAQWWSGKGKYSFVYSNIPNARLFLICLDSLTGIRWN